MFHCKQCNEWFNTSESIFKNHTSRTCKEAPPLPPVQSLSDMYYGALAAMSKEQLKERHLQQCASMAQSSDYYKDAYRYKGIGDNIGSAVAWALWY